MDNVKINVVVASDGKMPSYAHPGDAGMDLFSVEEAILAPMERRLVSTGVRMEIPPGYEAQIRPKSGLAVKHGISIVNTPGTIDAGYRGEVKVIMINLGTEPYPIKKGSKIAQMVINRVEMAEMTAVDVLEESSRNEGGFGSTGTK
ncbi:MAG: dUTP diphosphatase [DPANN group archaeon]|nr:dUTP diphosphatase [DPANN group archaeon]